MGVSINGGSAKWLVYKGQCIFNGKITFFTVCYWKWPIETVDLPIKKWWLSIAMLIYQRVEQNGDSTKNFRLELWTFIVFSFMVEHDLMRLNGDLMGFHQ